MQAKIMCRSYGAGTFMNTNFYKYDAPTELG
jgi:hypothetical protein